MPLAPDVDVTKLFFPEPDGVIRLKIIEAKQLENKDYSFVKKGKSDPYCEIQGKKYRKNRRRNGEYRRGGASAITLRRSEKIAFFSQMLTFFQFLM